MTTYRFLDDATARRCLHSHKPKESERAVSDFINHSLNAFNTLQSKVRELEAENADLREQLGEREIV